jgi:hypothetical protein
METVYKNCQSCGMPLKRDVAGGGTHADGTRSLMYCSHCYKDGQFIQPNITVDEMKLLVKGKLKGFGIPGLLTGVFTRNIPKLARWKHHVH